MQKICGRRPGRVVLRLKPLRSQQAQAPAAPFMVERHKRDPAELDKEYREFLGRYFGYMNIP